MPVSAARAVYAWPT